MSDGSAPSLGDEDAEVSDASEEAEALVDGTRKSNTSKPNAATENPQPKSMTSASADPFPPGADTAAMLNGMKIEHADHNEAEMHFDKAATEDGTEVADGSHPASDAPKAPRRETTAQRARREHQDYLKQRDSDPAFVPNRGGFFLHDDRSPNVSNFYNKPFGRGRGRGYNGVAPAG